MAPVVWAYLPSVMHSGHPPTADKAATSTNVRRWPLIVFS